MMDMKSGAEVCPQHSLQFEEEGHRYTVDGRRVWSVTQVLEAAKLIDLSAIPHDVLQRAAERGTRVHKAAALLLRGQLNWSAVSEEDGGYLMGLEKFLRNTGLSPIAETVETPLYCGQHDYCGTPDVVASFAMRRPARSVRVLVDWKTGMMPAVRYQLAGYAFPLQVRHRVAVKLNKDGTYRMVWFPPETLKQDFATFLRALNETRNPECPN